MPGCSNSSEYNAIGPSNDCSYGNVAHTRVNGVTCIGKRITGKSTVPALVQSMGSRIRGKQFVLGDGNLSGPTLGKQSSWCPGSRKCFFDEGVEFVELKGDYALGKRYTVGKCKPRWIQRKYDKSPSSKIELCLDNLVPDCKPKGFSCGKDSGVVLADCVCKQSDGSLDIQFKGNNGNDSSIRIPRGSVFDTNGVNPFPAVSMQWPTLDDWLVVDVEHLGRNHNAQSVAQYVERGKECIAKLTCDWMPALRNFKDMPVKQCTSDALAECVPPLDMDHNCIYDAMCIDIFTDGSGLHNR